MELPHLGEHCTEPSCNQLDYLPMRCDACQQLFCKDHLKYDDHNCHSKHKKDVQVPVCPLCNAPVPVARGALPDLAVSAHIDQDCKQKEKEKVFTNRCNKARCKKKELVKITCDSCQLNFCLTHRHPKDHDCQGPRAVSNLSAAAAQSRTGGGSTQSKITNFFSGPFRTGGTTTASSSSTSRPTTSVSASSQPTAVRARASVTARAHNGMSEDEALAAALAASMADVPSGGGGGGVMGSGYNAASLSQEEQDRMLAQALQAGII